LGNPLVHDFLARENPGALAAMQARFAALHRAGLWVSRRNSIRAQVMDG
jgi:cobaltochelatase CobN